MPSRPANWPDLNPDQRAAVMASMDPQLVVAGPGTGKTRVLVCRAAHLIEHEAVTPSRLVLVTFTRRAAQQLTNRLTTLVGPEAQHVRAGTIHHFCYETLRAHSASADVPDDFIVVDDTVTDAFWQRWYEAHERWCKAHDLHSYRQVKTHVSRIKLGIDTVSGQLTDGLREYDQMLTDRGALDFDDLLVETRDLLRNHPDVRADLVEETEAVLVDEFQDTDPVQFDVIRRLGEAGAHLYCVADDDQSVYRFRGARPANLRRYIERFDCSEEQSTRHVLTTNYRSNRSIYAVAEAVLDADERLKQRGAIRTSDAGTQPVHLVACDDPEAERTHVLRQLRDWLDDGAERSDLAVLTRWNRRLAALERACLRAGFACETSQSENLLDTGYAPGSEAARPAPRRRRPPPQPAARRPHDGAAVPPTAGRHDGPAARLRRAEHAGLGPLGPLPNRRVQRAGPSERRPRLGRGPPRSDLRHDHQPPAEHAGGRPHHWCLHPHRPSATRGSPPTAPPLHRHADRSGFSFVRPPRRHGPREMAPGSGPRCTGRGPTPPPSAPSYAPDHPPLAPTRAAGA